MKKKRVVIIGGGIAGLAAAWSIREHQEASGNTADPPVEVVLIEGKDRLGGNIKTDRVDNFIVEGGPDCFISEKPWALQLCRRLGLEDELLTTNDQRRKTFVLSGGKLHELPEGVILMIPTRMMPLAASSLISMKGKARMAMEYFIPKKTDAGDESLGDFVRRRLGSEALDKIAEPLIAGIHAGDPETMSIKASFPKFVQLEQDYGSLIKGMLRRMASFKKSKKAAEGKDSKKPKGKVSMFMTLRDGLETLINTLANRLASHGDTYVKTGVRAESVRSVDGRYEIDIEGEPTLEADSVIIAAPAYATASLMEKEDTELADKLRTIPYVSTSTISLGYNEEDMQRPLNGFGFVVPRVENRRVMASTWTSVKFDHRAPEGKVLIRCFVGGTKRADLVNLSDEEMVKLVREELEDILGITAEPLFARVYRYVNAMPQYTIGHVERVEGIMERAATHPGLFITGSAYKGIGIADSVRNGEIVAKKALHHVGWKGGENEDS